MNPTRSRRSSATSPACAVASRRREFVMKDAYRSTSTRPERASYDKMEATYRRIRPLRPRLPRRRRGPGAIGGSEERRVPGPRRLRRRRDRRAAATATTPRTSRSRDREGARGGVVRRGPAERTKGTRRRRRASRRSRPSSGSRRTSSSKSLVYTAGKEVVLAIVRGDHDVNEIRLRARSASTRSTPRERRGREERDRRRGRLRGPGRLQGPDLVDRAAAAVKERGHRRQRDGPTSRT